MRPCRTKIIDLNDFINLTNKQIGSIGEEIGCRTLNIKNRNIVDNNFETTSDTVRHEIFGYIEIKISTYNKTYMLWGASVRRNQEFDNLLVLCMDNKEPWENVERAYMVPYKAIIDNDNHSQYRVTITINGWRFKKFEIDEKPYDLVWQNMKKERYLKLF